MDKAKNRFSSLDLYGIVKEIKEEGIVEGSFLHNIYDCPLSGSSGYGNEAHDRAFIFRFTKQSNRTNIVIHPGVRVNVTKYERSTCNKSSDAPSHFVSKLRKHLRDRRLLSLDQLGHDRILRLCFSGHDGGLSLWIEFYGKGNLILSLTQSQEIICLARENPFSPGMAYPSDTFNSLPLQRPFFGFVNSVSDDGSDDGNYRDSDGNNDGSGSISTPKQQQQPEKLKTKKDVKMFLRKEIPCLSPEIIEHTIIAVGEDFSFKAIEDCLSAVFEEMKTLNPRIYYKNSTPLWPSPIPLLCFGDHLLNSQTTATETTKQRTFNECVDEYWRGLEEREMQRKTENASSALERKMNQVRFEQEERLLSLQNKAADEGWMARMLEEKIEEVGKIIEIFKECLKNEMDWQEISSLIEDEREIGNPLALMISPLDQWKGGDVDLLLDDFDGFGGFDNSENGNTSKKPLKTPLKTSINIFKTPFANAGQHWKKREEALAKLGRTRDAFEMAVKASQGKAIRQQKLKAAGGQQHRVGVCKRKGMWMEKFSWFISSDSFIVVGGNDAQQNEYLVKRVLRKGDVYLHADIPGASSVIVKNHGFKNGITIPQRTLQEAGTFSLCKSKAWDAKIVTSAWWVNSEQVSKSAMSGEYLPSGSFMIRGKKNFLAPMPLVLGFGIMYLVPKEVSIHRKKEREEREKERLCGGGDGGGGTGDSLTDEINMDKYQLIGEGGGQSGAGGDDEFYVGADINTKNSNKTQMSKQAAAAAAIHHHQVPPPQKKKGNAGSGGIGSRGKKGKLKKIKKKYANQDEEDKEIMMSLLQSSAPKALNDEERPEIKKAVFDRVPKKATASVPDDSSNNNSSNHHHQGSDHTTKDDELIEEIEGLEINPIDSLLGNPNLENLSITEDLSNAPTYAIPVCGPYSALSGYGSRIKLLPGNLKRGTATKLTMALIQGEIKKKKCEPGLEEGLNNILLSLIRGIPESILNITMPSKVRIGTSQKEQQVIRRKIGKEGRRK